MAGDEEEFARQFAKVWKKPDPRQMAEMLDPEVVLYQSEWPPIHGREGAFEEFSRLLEWVPDVHGHVVRHLGANGLLFIEWRMILPMGSDELLVEVVDRFLLRNGLATERRAFFDEQPLMTGIMARPTAWSGYLKYRNARMRDGEADRDKNIA